MEKPEVVDAAGLQTLQILSKADLFNRWMYDEIKLYLKGEILEIGSGLGNISKFLIKDGYTISLSDYNLNYCQYLKDHFANHPNVRQILSINLQHQHFYEKYALLKQQFDTIYLLNVIEHLADDVKAVEYCSFLLKSGGHLIVLAPAYQLLYSRFDKELGHYRRYTAGALKNLLEKCHFTTIRKRYFNAAGIAGWLLFGKLLNRKLLGKKEITTFNRLVPLFKFVDTFLLKKVGLSVIIIGAKV